jgi:Calcineurin-like phosphoesterase superfamily domain
VAGPGVAALAVRIYHDGPTFERIAALADCDMLVLGHTHKPWIHEYGGVLFVKCGSVDKPKDGDALVAFAALEARGDTVAPSIRRIAYDTIAREMRTVGLPAELAEKLVAAAYFGRPSGRKRGAGKARLAL